MDYVYIIVNIIIEMLMGLSLVLLMLFLLNFPTPIN